MRSRWFALVTLLAACGAPSASVPEATPAWFDELLALDPTLGGAELLRRRIGEDPTLIWAELDAEQEAERDRVLLAAIADEQPAMRVLVQQQIDAATAREVIAFLRGDTGRALAAAQLAALTRYPVMAAEEFAGGCALLGDPERVDEAARWVLWPLLAEIGERAGSPSPPGLAWLMSAVDVSPEQARRIGEFCGSETGRRWSELQQAAVAAVRPVRHRLVDVARSHGWVRSAYDDLDLTLPRAEFDDAPDGDPDGGR